MKLRKLRPSPGALIGTIALVFALTGAAVAANRVQTNDIARKAVTGKKIARDAVKSGKILDGKVKERDLADGVLPAREFGRINKNDGGLNVAAGAVGIVGVADGGAGTVCYDLAELPKAGTATVLPGGDIPAVAELEVGPNAGCPAPFNDAKTVTRGVATGDPVTDGDPVNRDLYVHFIG